VISILRYDGIDEGIALANNTEFGLGSLVFGTDIDAAQAAVERMDTGSVGVSFFASNHAAPFVGRNDSGLGTEYGPEGLAAYLSYKSIHRRRGRPAANGLHTQRHGHAHQIHSLGP
jgi:aldehyde dehydrogenase (NAD+)